jgi:hypothetical protein
MPIITLNADLEAKRCQLPYTAELKDLYAVGRKEEDSWKPIPRSHTVCVQQPSWPSIQSR